MWAKTNTGSVVFLFSSFFEFPKSKFSEAKLIPKIIPRETTDVTESLQLCSVDVLCVGHSVSFYVNYSFNGGKLESIKTGNSANGKLMLRNTTGGCFTLNTI